MSDTYEPDLEGYDDEIEIEEVDAGEGDADEGEVDHDGSEEGEVDQTAEGQEVSHEQVKAPSRAERRFQKLANETKELKAELERVRAERTTTQTAEQTRISEAAERERLQMMDPAERLEYLINKKDQEHSRQLQQLRFEMADSADKTAFEGLCSRNPTASRLQAEVESRLAELRRNGTTAPRETVLKFLIGERALANAGRATGKARKAADTARTNQTARAGSARGDVQGEGRRGGNDAAARAKRLADMQI